MSLIKNYFKSKRIRNIFIFITYVSKHYYSALIPKKGKGVYDKNNFFEQIKNKYPESFNKKIIL